MVNAKVNLAVYKCNLDMETFKVGDKLGPTKFLKNGLMDYPRMEEISLVKTSSLKQYKSFPLVILFFILS